VGVRTLAIERGLDAPARLEAELGARATYFVSLHSDLYNPFVPVVLARLREIAALGHWIGLHFKAISLHSPSVSGTDGLDAERLGGMIHDGARSVRDGCTYLSDSNGYWRFERLAQVVAAGGHERLHVLRRPKMWQEHPMGPRERILRCIEGRGRASEATYDALLADNRRVNVGLPEPLR
jgi:hypothetical protein